MSKRCPSYFENNNNEFSYHQQRLCTEPLMSIFNGSYTAEKDVSFVQAYSSAIRSIAVRLGKPSQVRWTGKSACFDLSFHLQRMMKLSQCTAYFKKSLLDMMLFFLQLSTPSPTGSIHIQSRICDIGGA